MNDTAQFGVGPVFPFNEDEVTNDKQICPGADIGFEKRGGAGGVVGVLA